MWVMVTFEVPSLENIGPIWLLARFLLQVSCMKPKDEGDYELVEPFETNDNSLKGVNSEIAFTLGVGC